MQYERRVLGAQRPGRLADDLLVEVLEIGVVVVMDGPGQALHDPGEHRHRASRQGDDRFLDGPGCLARRRCRISIVTHRSRRLRSEEHTSELQSLMRISYAVFCLKKKINKNHKHV